MSRKESYTESDIKNFEVIAIAFGQRLVKLNINEFC
jgi:hypothetical protein